MKIKEYSDILLTNSSMKSFLRVCLFSLLALAGYGQNTLKLKVKLAVEPLLEKGDIYLSTDFNDWNAGEEAYRLQKIGKNEYSITLEDVPDRFEYKFSQGSWATAEGTPAGRVLPNRQYVSSGLDNQVLSNTILGWEEQIAYSMVLKSIPDNTPKDARIYIAGNFNNWGSGDELYRLKKSIDGSYRVKVYTDLEELEFKFTRGDWESVESRESGKARPNRRISRAEINQADDLEFNVAGWEDLHGVFSFYSIYDLLLLFSVFQGVLLLIAIPSLQSRNRAANRWLLLTIGVSSIAILFYVLSNYNSAVQGYPKVLFMSDLVIFLYAPLYYFYLRKLLFKAEKLPTRWYFHFIPFLIQVFIYLPFFLDSDKSMLDRIMNQEAILVYLFMGSGFFGLLWNAYYWFLFRKTIKNYREQFQTNFSYEQNLNYLNTVLLIYFICLFVWAVFFLVFGLSRQLGWESVSLQENFVDLIWLCFSVITYILGYFAIHQPETFKVDSQSVSIFDDILESTVSQKVKAPATSKTLAKAENFKPVIEALEKNIAKNKPFHNSKLTLSELAKQIDTQPHILSKAINEHYGKNFFDLINGYRIDEFKSLIKEPKFQNFTLLALAYEVGFNSKTAFNRSFKKATKQTPKEYFEQTKKEAP